MITEKTLRKWRREALCKFDLTPSETLLPYDIVKLINNYQKAILALTQELMDLYLIKKG